MGIVAAMEAHMQMKMTLFDGDDHEVWIIKKRKLLMARDVWNVIKSGFSEENINHQIIGFCYEPKRSENQGYDGSSYAANVCNRPDLSSDR